VAWCKSPSRHTSVELINATIANGTTAMLGILPISLFR
jgi:hypothetical protein